MGKAEAGGPLGKGPLESRVGRSEGMATPQGRVTPCSETGAEVGIQKACCWVAQDQIVLIGMCTDPEERGEGRAKIPEIKEKIKTKRKGRGKAKRDEEARPLAQARWKAPSD